MSTIRVSLATYLTSEDHLQDWELVKQHYNNVGDAATLRELIRNKAADIRSGNTKRQALDDIRSELQSLRQESQALRDDVDSIKHLLRVLCEKVGVAVVADR